MADTVPSLVLVPEVRRSAAWQAAFAPPAREERPPFGIGHNGGPPLQGLGMVLRWQAEVKAAWKAPVEVVRRRMKLAEACGLTYREYTLEILERGRWLTPGQDSARIAQIIAGR